ncbi:regulator of G protein [Tritrichomonas foetus]|uniref:Regulator of G protein n=1 Tax=Tritrichomonas foetus TaxID=1144522 RepID=A0A1J4KQR6_9EUKA|nr:regulator of G protein [Tritrichomonas foetus]|eukprot:OHT13272.1 regulator of G protein [Tritrichomonas foetus]
MALDLLNSPYALLFGSFWIFWSCYFIFNLALFFKNQNSFYIKNRAPWLIFCSALGQYGMMTSLTFKILLTPADFPNIIDHWFIWLMIPLHLIPYPVRSLRFIILYNVNDNPELTDENRATQPCPKRFWDWFRRHPKFLTDKAFLIFNWCLMAIAIVIGLVRNIVEETNWPGHYGAPNSTLFFAWCIFLLIAVSFFLWVAYYYIGKVNDGLYYNFEIAAIGIIWFVFIGLYIILGWAKVQPAEIQSIMGIILCVASFLVSFGLPVQLAVVKPPNVNFGSALDKIETIMEPANEELKKGKDLFREFLTQRACEEGFMFYDAVKKYQKESDSEKRQEMFRIIKRKYIENDAICHINIDSNEINRLLELKEENISNETFNAAFEKNKYLLQVDQFPHFKCSAKAKAWANEILKKKTLLMGGDYLATKSGGNTNNSNTV